MNKRDQPIKRTRDDIESDINHQEEELSRWIADDLNEPLSQIEIFRDVNDIHPTITVNYSDTSSVTLCEGEHNLLSYNEYNNLSDLYQELDNLEADL